MATASQLGLDYRTLGRPEGPQEFQSAVFCGIPSFIGAQVLPPVTEELTAAGVKAAVLGIPWEGGELCRPGTSYAPRHIRLASENYQDGHHAEFQADIFENLNLADCGDVAVVPSRELTFERAERCVSAIYRAGAFPVIFGGDDSTTIAVATAIAREFEGTLGYIHIDSHSDTWDEIAGEKIWAGSTVIRIAELPNVDSSKIAIAGLNGPLACPKDFSDYVKEKQMQVSTIWDIDERGVEAVVKEIIDNVWTGTDGVILHTDLDSMDHPGVSAPESGALTSREVLKMVREFVRQGVEGYAIVEGSPAYDHGQNAARVGARLALDALAIRANPNGTGRAWTG